MIRALIIQRFLGGMEQRAGKMLRDDRQVAMNEVRGQLLALAEYYRYASSDVDDAAARYFEERAAQCAEQAEALSEAIRQLGDLPDGSKPDSYLFHELAETVMASISGNHRSAHLKERLEEERSLIRYVDQALLMEALPHRAVQLLRTIREAAGSALRRLERIGSGGF